MSVNLDTFEGVALSIHCATRLDHLAESLAGVLSGGYRSPFERRIVAVPERGVQRWLNQRLSHHLHPPGQEGVNAGIAAGIDYRSPRNLVELFLPAAVDAWDPRRLAWHILAVVDDSHPPDWAEPLRRYFDAGASARYRAAKRLAGLFAAYAAERPAMLREWASGQATDGTGPLEADLGWQPELYRELLTRLGAPPRPLQVGAALTAAQRHGITDFHVFGYPRLSAADIELLGALEVCTDAHLWMAVPRCERLRREPMRGGSELLEALGRQSAEFLARLTGQFPRAVWTEEGSALPHRAPTLLGQIQADVSYDRAPVRGRTPDGSVQIHACHGPTRQVEVLREVLTGLFEDDPSLEPRDVLVLCPDLEAYAPLFHATFSPQTGHPGANLRVSVAEGGHAGRNPLFDLARSLVALVGGRVRSTDILDLLHTEEVKRRLGLADADVETLTTWIKESGIRWGFDADHREGFGVKTEQNTIEAGLRRLLLAVALPGEEPLAGVLPLGEVGSTEIDLVGVFVEFLRRLHAGVTELATATTLPQWSGGLRRLLTAIAVGDEHQESQFTRALGELARHGEVRASRADVQHLIEELQRSRGAAAGLRTGALTVASLGTLRAVPHRVVCLVGMDDGAFPRPAAVDGDDVLARRARAGEKNPRREDRQLFLDSIMSATSHVIITYSGAGEQRGEELAPAVPVAQLIDTITRTTTPVPPPVTTHPLHPFDHRYFTGAGLVSFDERSARAARMRRHPHPPPPFLPQPVQAEPRAEITLRELHRFYADPVKYFIHDEAGVYLTDGADTTPSAIPLALDPLETWQVADRLLRRCREEGWAAPEIEHELLRATVAPGKLGRHTLTEISGTVAALARAAAEHGRGTPRSVPIDLDVAGRAITGKVDDLYEGTLVHATYSTLAPKHRFAAWLDLLALTAQHPQRPWNAVVVGRSGKRAVTRELRAPEPRAAREILTELLDLYDRGVREPLPLPPRTSAAWAEAVRGRGEPASQAARAALVAQVGEKWETVSEGFSNEDTDRYQRLAWGGVIAFSELLEIPAPGDERWAEEPSRFGQLSRRMWERMLDHEL